VCSVVMVLEVKNIGSLDAVTVGGYGERVCVDVIY
jgi:hypothetical protein